MDQDSACDVWMGNAFELFNFHFHPLFGECAVHQVDVDVDQIRLGLELVGGFQQQGAQVTGVFEVVGLQLQVAALGVRHFTVGVRPAAARAVLGLVGHLMCAYKYLRAFILMRADILRNIWFHFMRTWRC